MDLLYNDYIVATPPPTPIAPVPALLFIWNSVPPYCACQGQVPALSPLAGVLAHSSCLLWVHIPQCHPLRPPARTL